MKTPFVTKDQLEAICQQYPTPFHLYDERGIRETARRVQAAFSWNAGFREHFAVKANPNPYILSILLIVIIKFKVFTNTDCITFFNAQILKLV